MKTLARFLKPAPLVLMIFLLGVGLVLVFCTSHSTTIFGGAAEETTLAFGFGQPVTVVTGAGEKTVHVKWVTLAYNLVLIYFASALLAALFSLATGSQRTARTFALITAGMLALTFLTSIGISRIYWGYFFFPPGLLSEVNEIRHVDRIVAFRTLNALADHYSIVANNDYPLASHLKSARERAPAEFDDRLLLALDRKQLLPADFESSTRDFPELYPLIQRTGRLLASNPGYQSHTDLSGIAVDGRDSQGRRLLFLSFTGGQLSNDHYPYYEMFFREPPAASAFTLVRSQHYFYDASGMEGFEWYVIWMFIAAPGIALGALLFGIIRAVVLHREEAKHLEPA